MKKISLAIFLVVLTVVGFCQENRALWGKILEKETHTPIPGVDVLLLENNRWITTDKKGEFLIENLSAFEYSIEMHCLGYKNHVVKVNPERHDSLVIYLQASSYKLGEVMVLESKGERMATSSYLGTDALEHAQPVSLGDILELLPGGLISNPDLSGPQQIAVRDIGTDANSASGASIVIDGAPVDNDANFQTLSTVQLKTNTTSVTQLSSLKFSTTVGRGVDLRQIPSENIESVEVIRGIPSVEYGDLTSGVVVVNTKAGYTPLEIKLKSDPNIKFAAFNKGIRLRDEGALNISLDYISSYNDMRSKYDGFDRLTGQLGLFKTFFKSTAPLSFNAKFNCFSTLDEKKTDPDAMVQGEVYKMSDKGARFNIYGQWALNNKLVSNIKYKFSVSSAWQESYQKRYRSGSLSGISLSMQEGENYGIYLPSESLTELTIKGRPVSTFGQIVAAKNSIIKNEIINKILVGVEYRDKRNKGEGSIYDIENPPVVSSISSRPRSYNEIPALNSLSFFVEDKISVPVNKTTLNVQAGLRMNNFQPTGLLKGDLGFYYEPRINAGWNLWKNRAGFIKELNLRGGIGITYKSPSLMYLYPDKAYFDLVSLGYYSGDPATEAIVFTTKIFDPSNPDLKPAKNMKMELGVDFIIGKVKGNITAYEENMTDGFGLLNQYQFVDYRVYDEKAIPEDVKPDIATLPFDSAMHIVEYSSPVNNKKTKKYGVEYSFDFGKIPAISTKISVSGAWKRTERIFSTSDYEVLPRNSSSGQHRYIAVYPSGESKVAEQFNTSFRFVTHSPQLRLVLTTTLQMLWYEKYYYPYFEEVPEYLYDEAGEEIVFTSLMKDDPAYRDYVETKPGNYFKEEVMPVLPLCQVKLSKELGDQMKLSFYANNFINYRPMYRYVRSNSYVRRNPSIYFGAEIKISL